MPNDVNAALSPIVETVSGKIRGSTQAGIHAFKGIPYGASTAGANRFQPPRPAESWAGERDALALGGRAPQLRSGQGSLQEIDHVPFVKPLAKLATTATATAEIPSLVDEALRAAIAPHSGPTFLDFPLDYVFTASAEPG